MHQNKTLILGLGNTLRRDDGLGPAVIEGLQSQKLANADVQVGGQDGLTLLESIREYPRAIVIDAVDMGMPAGEVRIFAPGEVRVKSDSLSTHGFGLAEAMELMPMLDIQTELKIIGVQPESIEFGQGLGEKVSNSLGKVVELVKEQL